MNPGIYPFPSGVASAGASGGGSSGGPKFWELGETVAQWDYRKSILDGEIYQRSTPAGSGAVDPADEIVNYVASSFRRITSLPSILLAGQGGGASSNSLYFNGVTKAAINGITAATRTQILNTTGRGNVSFLGVYKNATGDGRVEIIVDGRALVDVITTNASDVTAHNFIGSTDSGGKAGFNLFSAIRTTSPVEFRRSFAVFYTPITTATGTNATLGYSLEGTR